MQRKKIIPQYGPLAGVRVVIAGSLIAMPHAAAMLADFGAEVIAFERKGAGETYRLFPPHIKNENGTVEEPGLTYPFTNDYITTLTAAFGALSAYIHAMKTGEGQVVEVSQYESQARVMSDLFVLIPKPVLSSGLPG